MIKKIIDILLSSAEGAFLQVVVFVGAVLLIFGYINYKTQGRFVDKLERSKKLQPIIGALLGLTPGCGGAIFIMPLYLKGSVTFGTVVATLIATMGDSAFVLISTKPLQYLAISVLSFITAIATGYVVDKLKLDGGFEKRRQLLLAKNKMSRKEHDLIQKTPLKHIGHKEGDSIDVIFHHNKQKVESNSAYRFTHNFAYTIFWLLIAIGLILGILLLFQVDINKSLGISNLGTYIGIIGTLFSFIYMIVGKKNIKNNEYNEEEEKILSFKETLIHNAQETAFVGTWVFVAYFAYEILVLLIGGEVVVQNWMLATGLFSVVLGAVIGLIPGCGLKLYLYHYTLKVCYRLPHYLQMLSHKMAMRCSHCLLSIVDHLYGQLL